MLDLDNPELQMQGNFICVQPDFKVFNVDTTVPKWV